MILEKQLFRVPRRQGVMFLLRLSNSGRGPQTTSGSFTSVLLLGVQNTLVLRLFFAHGINTLTKTVVFV